MGAPRKPVASYGDAYTEMPGLGIHALGPNAIIVIDRNKWPDASALALQDALRPDVLMIAVDDLADISVLDEDVMRAAGWVRA